MIETLGLTSMPGTILLSFWRDLNQLSPNGDNGLSLRALLTGFCKPESPKSRSAHPSFVGKILKQCTFLIGQKEVHEKQGKTRAAKAASSGCFCFSLSCLNISLGYLEYLVEGTWVAPTMEVILQTGNRFSGPSSNIHHWLALTQADFLP